MDYTQRLAALAQTSLPAELEGSNQCIQFVRPLRRARLRALSALTLTSLLIVFLIYSDTPIGIFEIIISLTALYFSVSTIRRAVFGDVLAVLEKGGLRVKKRLIPWPALKAVEVQDNGSLRFDVDETIDPSGDLLVKFRSANVGVLQDAVGYVLYG
jgi:hypothetical protein